MPYEVKKLADSISPEDIRLTSFQLTYPRMVHAELMTHRVFSRNSASSRAIPSSKMREMIKNDPVIPIYWGKNQSGMQAGEELKGWELEEAKFHWLNARDNMLYASEVLEKDGAHKQIVNRLTEPWMWITVITTATEWDNWYKLRAHKDAQPEIRHLAEMMLWLYAESEPKFLNYGEWHLPLWGVSPEDRLAIPTIHPIRVPGQGSIDFPREVLISVGRCARVSYLTHEGIRDPNADITLAVDRLIHPENTEDPSHWSPWEHVAIPFSEERWKAINETQKLMKNRYIGLLKKEEIVEMMRNLEFSGNFRGWTQARKYFIHESGAKWMEKFL